MKSATRSIVRATAAVLGTGGLLLGLASPASADPAGPNCTAADTSAVITEVSAAMTSYLLSHPDVNNFFTGLQGQGEADATQQTRDYLNANPQIRADIAAIRAPSINLRNRCGIPLEAEIDGLA